MEGEDQLNILLVSFHDILRGGYVKNDVVSEQNKEKQCCCSRITTATTTTVAKAEKEREMRGREEREKGQWRAIKQNKSNMQRDNQGLLVRRD